MAKKQQTRSEIMKAEQNALKDAFLRAYVAAGFNQSKAMESVGIKSRQTIHNWKKADPGFARAMIETREAEGDWYESQLRILAAGIPKVNADGKLIGWEEKPDATAINSVLNAKFKDRGYGYRIRHEHEHSTKKESRIDLTRLTKEQREQWYMLLDLATIPEDEIQEAEVIE